MPITTDDAQEILTSVFPDWVKQLRLRVAGIGGESVTISMPARDEIRRIGNAVSGQASLALVDTAMVVALANALGGFRPVGTVDLTFSFMRPMQGPEILCEATVLRLGRSMAFCRAELRETGSDRIAVHATGTYAVPPSTPG